MSALTRIAPALVSALGVLAACASNPPPSAALADCARPILIVDNHTEADVLIYERDSAAPGRVIGRASPGRTEIPVDFDPGTAYSARTQDGRDLPSRLVSVEAACGS